MNGAVAFLHHAGLEARLLELPVHIAGEHPGAPRHGLGPAAQQRKALVRHRVAVQLQAVAVKAPGQARAAPEVLAARCLGKTHVRLRQHRVGLPETGIAAKVRQARIHPHARTGAHDQGIRLADQVGGSGDGGVQIGHGWLYGGRFLVRRW